MGGGLGLARGIVDKLARVGQLRQGRSRGQWRRLRVGWGGRGQGQSDGGRKRGGGETSLNPCQRIRFVAMA